MKPIEMWEHFFTQFYFFNKIAKIIDRNLHWKIETLRDNVGEISV